MSNHKFVCFECREAVKRSLWPQTEVRCPVCANECLWIGVKIPVPPKNKIKLWEALREQLDSEKVKIEEAKRIQNVRAKHELEKEIQKIAALPVNEGRQSLLRNLRSKLNAIDV